MTLVFSAVDETLVSMMYPSLLLEIVVVCWSDFVDWLGSVATDFD